jgi:hypothetical protein
MKQAQILLDKAEALDSYVRSCSDSPVNAKARIFCQYIPWSDQALAAVAATKLPRRSSEAAAEIVILSTSAEGGMPHTRPPNLICVPAYFPESKLKDTLEHELVHIDQRKNPGAWRKHLAVAGWTPASSSDIPDEWLKRTRINPDTFDARFWKWKGRHIPLPLFTREDKPEIHEITVRWWDTQDNRLNNTPPTSFTQEYGPLGVSSAEHPYELYAYHIDEWTRSRISGPPQM